MKTSSQRSNPSLQGLGRGWTRLLTAALGLVLALAACGSGKSPAAAPLATGETPPALMVAAHPRIYLNSRNLTRLKGLLAAKDESAMRFQKMVDTGIAGGDVYNFQAWHAALMGALSGQPKYCADAIARTDQWVAAEEELIGAGERAKVADDSYLEVGSVVGSLSLTLDWCYASVSPVQRQRWVLYANEAVWNVWHHSDARWGLKRYAWTGWSVDNPSNNYYYSFLKATLLLGLASRGENPDAPAWIAKFRDEKIGAQLVPTFTRDLAGGGSREGTGYGTAMKNLFWLYDVWEASTTERIADLTPQTQASMAYLMHATVPTLDRIAPLGDHSRDSTAALFDYHREYAEALAWLYPDDAIAKPLRTWLASISVPKMAQGFEMVYDFIYRNPAAPSEPLASLGTAWFAPGAGHLFARSSWERNATWINFVMGPYTESHAHHDQLSFLIYKNQWLAYDANIESHSGIVQAESAHNLVRIERDGKVLAQREGADATKVLALSDQSSFLYAAADATAIYDGDGANGVRLAQREMLYLKPDVLVVYDRIDAGKGVQAIWQLNSPLLPALAGNTASFGGTDGLVLHALLPVASKFKSLKLPDTDKDFGAGYRLEQLQPAEGPVQFLYVLSLASAVRTVSTSKTDSTDDLSIALANGGTATVRFNRSKPGGSLSLTGAAGSFTGSLPSSVVLPQGNAASKTK